MKEKFTMFGIVRKDFWGDIQIFIGKDQHQKQDDFVRVGDTIKITLEKLEGNK
jgi:hypothetical protein